jgi:RHH-type proline utilization regulon transcriptional repressor/proline dehydrogenase/delta 1-pyrroline-5-carboxylate dehydrogenase
MSTALGLVPDVLAWWGGGQTGYLHTSARWFVPGPLTLVSTWDGDELSLIRQHHQLRAARHVDVAAGSRALDDALAAMRVSARGLGAYRVVDGAAELADTLAHHGIAVRRFPNGALGIIPALDQIEAAATALKEAVS